MLGYDQRNHGDNRIQELVNKLNNIDVGFEEEREDARNTSVLANRKMQEYNKNYYNKHHKTPSKYNEGDYVMIRDLVNKIGENSKLKSNYKGPF